MLGSVRILRRFQKCFIITCPSSPSPPFFFFSALPFLCYACGSLSYRHWSKASNSTSVQGLNSDWRISLIWLCSWISWDRRHTFGVFHLVSRRSPGVEETPGPFVAIQALFLSQWGSAQEKITPGPRPGSEKKNTTCAINFVHASFLFLPADCCESWWNLMGVWIKTRCHLGGDNSCVFVGLHQSWSDWSCRSLVRRVNMKREEEFDCLCRGVKYSERCQGRASARIAFLCPILSAQ